MGPKIDQGISYLRESRTYGIASGLPNSMCLNDFFILFVLLLKYQMRTLCCNPLNALEIGESRKEWSPYVPEAIPCSPELEDGK